jgi:uncharacterized protein YjbI with pentapeptide repeats
MKRTSLRGFALTAALLLTGAGGYSCYRRGLEQAAAFAELCPASKQVGDPLCGVVAYRRLAGANRTDAVFARARLQEILIFYSRLPNADFRQARVTGEISNSQLDGANFSGADLRGLRLIDVRLRQANFTGADLRATLFDRTDVSSADFSGADLTDVAFLPSTAVGAKFDGRTKLPFARETALQIGMIDVSRSR